MARKEIDLKELLKSEHPREYQDALIFRTAFQKSKTCLLFRIAWNIPQHGFKDHKEYEKWHVALLENTNAYYKSKKYKDTEKKIHEQKILCDEGKLNPVYLNIYLLKTTFAIPLSKYEYDIDQLTLRSGKPIYFREYIEECILFETPRISFPTRPLPEPILKWDFNNQFYNLVIENIFPDTITKDFTNRKFTEKLKEVQKKLSGYSTKKTRIKKSLDFGLQVLELDGKQRQLDDFQKMESITGKDLALNVTGKEEQKLKNKVKQARLRTKKYLE